MTEPRPPRRHPNRPQSQRPQRHRLEKMRAEGIPPAQGDAAPRAKAMVDCGWGRLIFAHTFPDADSLAEALRAEEPDRRDIAFYARDPQVALSAAPQELFLDPSHALRLDLATYRPAHRQPRGYQVRRLSTRADAEALNAIYAARGMATVSPDFLWSACDPRALTFLVAEDDATGAVIGGVMGVDHARAFDDPEHGASLWALAVDADAAHPGVGEALSRRLAEQFKTRGAAFMDLSVMHDNADALSLYEKLGFRRIPVFAIKRKNPFNEKLYIGPAPEEGLNPYARIIVDEARRRGILVEVTDAAGGFFRLTHGGRSIRCRESLSDLTSAVAMALCDDKAATRRLVARAGLTAPDQITDDNGEARAAFLAKHGAVVVKPARGEQGRGVAVGLTTPEAVEAAVVHARAHCDTVIVEEMAPGEDLRLVVIGGRVVACAVRRPPRVVGDGHSSLRALIEKHSRRRAAATGGESRIPLDAETERCLADEGLTLDSVPEAGREVIVRKTANLHTGGVIHDVTEETHPALIEAAEAAARALEIPVVGIDLMVKSPRLPDYAFIEANERPGLANHDPQPTAERFIDLLFPRAIPESARAARARKQS